MIQQWSMPYARTWSVLWSMKQWLDWSMTRLGWSISRYESFTSYQVSGIFLVLGMGTKMRIEALAYATDCLPTLQRCVIHSVILRMHYLLHYQSTTHVIRAIHKKSRNAYTYKPRVSKILRYLNWNHQLFGIWTESFLRLLSTAITNNTRFNMSRQENFTAQSSSLSICTHQQRNNWLQTMVSDNVSSISTTYTRTGETYIWVNTTKLHPP